MKTKEKINIGFNIELESIEKKYIISNEKYKDYKIKNQEIKK